MTSERDALLSNPAAKPSVTPLPKLQLALLMFMRISEPVAFTVIFPFVNQQVADLHITDSAKTVGYYSGYIESAFAIAQFLTILQWGRLSDRIGRRPTLCFGLFGAAFSVVLFGLSRSLPAMIGARCLSGVLNGNSGVLKSALGELTDKTNEGKVFALMPLTYSIGVALGQTLGGQLANPVDRFPRVFGGNWLLTRFPYLLPCIAAACLPLLASLLGLLFLKETLASKIDQSESKNITESDESAPLLPAPQKEAPPTVMSLLKDRKIRIVLLNYSMFSFFTNGLMVIQPLFAFTPQQDGGLGLKPSQIGNALATRAFMVIFIQSVLFGGLQSRLGTTALYQIFINFFPAAVVTLAVSSYLSGTAAMVAFFVALACTALGNMGSSCNMLLINSVSPSKSALGTMNGLSQSGSAAMRAISPSAASTLFAFSISHPHILSGRLVWLVMFFATGLGSVLSWSLPKYTPPRRQENP